MFRVKCVTKRRNQGREMKVLECLIKAKSVTQSRKQCSKLKVLECLCFGSNPSRKVEISEERWRFWSVCFGVKWNTKSQDVWRKIEVLKCGFRVNMYKSSIFSHSRILAFRKGIAKRIILRPKDKQRRIKSSRSRAAHLGGRTSGPIFALALYGFA